jgi:hypothetical protein
MPSLRAFLAKSSLRRDLTLIAVSVVVIAGLSVRQTYHEYRLSRHSQRTEANVVSRQGGHGWIEYEYTVDGHTYTGSTPATATGKGFDEVRIGDKLSVFFDPTDPGVSGTAETRDIPRDTIPWLAAILIIGSGLAFLRHALREE